MKYLVLIQVLFITLTCSNERSDKIKSITKNYKNIITMDEDSLSKILKLQIQSGYAIKEKGLDMISEYNYTENDYKEMKKISVDILKSHGYKFINDKDFKNKVKIIFNFSNIYTDINFLIEYPCKSETTVYQLDGNYVISNNNPLFIDYKNGVLLESLFISQLIDYKEKFPRIYQEEQLMPKEKTLPSGEVVEIIRWADFKELNQLRQKNIQTLVARNKYLFNDSKADLVWLKFNDVAFLESLVTTFGYTKDLDLDKFVLDNYLKSPEELGKVLWNKRCDGTIKVNQEMFDILMQADKPNAEKYLNAIHLYLENVRLNGIDEKINFSQKAEILGKIGYYAEKKARELKDNMYLYNKELQNDNETNEDFEKEFKKHNYYNIKDFKELWDETKTGGVGLPE